MKMNPLSISLTILTSMAITACGNIPETGAPNSSTPTISDQSSSDSIDKDQLQDVEYEVLKSIPGFAGFYIDKKGDYVVALSEKKSGNLTASNVHDYDAVIKKAYSLDVPTKKGDVTSQAKGDKKIKYIKVKYGLSDLAAVKSKIEKNMSNLNISAVGIDYRSNKIIVFFKPGTTGNIPFKELGIPEDSVTIAGTLKADPVVAANSYVRPFGSAVGIQTTYGSTSGECSVGPLIRRVSGTTTSYGFFTARHCLTQNTSVLQGGFKVGTATLLAPLSSGSVNADVAFITADSLSSLRKSQFAQMNFGYSSLGQYSSWGTYSTTPGTPVVGRFSYSYGLRGQIPGEISYSNLTVPTSNPDGTVMNVKNAWCSSLISDIVATYNGLPGQSGGIVLDPGNNVIGLTSSRTTITYPDGSVDYTYCFSTVQSAAQALSASGSFYLY